MEFTRVFSDAVCRNEREKKACDGNQSKEARRHFSSPFPIGLSQAGVRQFAVMACCVRENSGSDWLLASDCSMPVAGSELESEAGRKGAYVGNRLQACRLPML